eukprot:CAMPEP_0119307146 /NCGR_PEP_ID=MMETSP1333-20130426/7720_1 /TAXON_ID=418940 /ORGANISM="Scyphosphaera apsteinii, Strain RCC1455" /LENGTH=111 /DNA_ID=CAMNT_0007310621 /DNA_START=165 /DNA_END=501 /DNA_ORIENTATION=+
MSFSLTIFLAASFAPWLSAEVNDYAITVAGEPTGGGGEGLGGGGCDADVIWNHICTGSAIKELVPQKSFHTLKRVVMHASLSVCILAGYRPKSLCQSLNTQWLDSSTGEHL